MGQVWSKADFDGTNVAGFQGGRGSALAVTAQNPGPDGLDGTADDITAPLNRRPIDVSIDNSPGASCNHPLDRVRNFASTHVGGAHFLMGDGAVRFIGDAIDAGIYRGLSTIRGGEVSGQF